MERLGSFWRRLEGFILFLYTRLVIRTANFTLIGEENLSAAQASGRPVLYTLWHGLNLTFVCYGFTYHVPASFSVVIVGDERSDILAELSDRLGAKETIGIDMAGNPVASGRKLLNFIKKLKQGQQSFLCPDGPDGPAYVPKDGIIFIAEKAEATILPWGCWSKQAYIRRRWDHFLVPFPFARMAVVFGEPITVSRNSNKEALKDQVVAALHDAREQAMRASGVMPWR